jgi:hypothetical protein
VRKFGPSWKQSTGQTSTQSMYLHLMQFSVTTKVIAILDGGTLGAGAKTRKCVPAADDCATAAH